MKRIFLQIARVCIVILASTFVLQAQGTNTPPWTVQGNTGVSHTIIWPSSATISVGSRNIQVGDAIGYFYTVGSSTACAGYEIYNGSNNAITVWSDNSQTGAKDGFVVGENLTALLWDAVAGVARSITLTYSSGPTTFQANGISQISGGSASIGSSGPPWTVQGNTGNNHTIGWATTASASIEGRAFQAGDAVGYFYTVGNTTACAGYEIYTGSNTAITVWGDDSQTGTKDGFAVGENLSARVWDAQLGRELPAVITYASGPTTYQVNGISIISSISTTLNDTLRIPLQSGWNMVSTYVSSANMAIASVATSANIALVRSNSGTLFFPSLGINTLQTWRLTEGYQVFMNAADTLRFIGKKYNTEPIPLLAGWNIVAYHRTSPMNVVTALQSIASSIVLVKNNAGATYFPFLGTNSLGNMVPGQGYQVYVNAPATLVYPANTRSVAEDIRLSPMPEVLKTSLQTGNNGTLVLQMRGATGEEVGVYNKAGMLVGSGKFVDDIAVITIWGSDALGYTTGGAEIGEELSVRMLQATGLWSVEINNMRSMLNGESFDKLVYQQDMVLMGEIVRSASLQSGVYPSPAVEQTTIIANLSGREAVITVRDGVGRVVAIYKGIPLTNGELRYAIATAHLANGSYTAELQSDTGDRVIVRFMIVK